MFEILAVAIGLELEYRHGDYETYEECLVDIPVQAEAIADRYKTTIKQMRYYDKHEVYLFRFVYEGQNFTVKAKCTVKEETNEETDSNPTSE